MIDEWWGWVLIALILATVYFLGFINGRISREEEEKHGHRH